MPRHSTQRGFTLVELLLYIGVASLLIVTISSFITLMWEARVKNRTIAEVEQQGLQAMELITQTVRNAESVTVPSAGAQSSTLTVDAADAADDPTVFRESSGQLVIDEGSTPTTTAVTNDHVTVSGLAFTNLSVSGTPGVVRIEFTITYNASADTNPYTYEQTFIGSAVTR